MGNATGITVIVATYGDQDWMRRGLDAAHDTREQCAPAVTFAWHDKNGTLASARNRAAELVTAEWLCFLDADDRLEAGYLTAMRDAIRADVDDTLRLLVPAIDYGQGVHQLAPRASIWQGNWLPIGTVIHRELFLAAEGFWNERAWEDWSLWIRAVGMGARLVHVKRAVYRARPHRPDGRNEVPQPYVLGRDIRETNRKWLVAHGYPDSIEARAFNMQERHQLEVAE